MLLTLSDKAHEGWSVLIGNSKLKIGTPVELEGFSTTLMPQLLMSESKIDTYLPIDIYFR